MGKEKRGFNSMDLERRRQIASMGGKAAHANGSAHKFTPDEAREAGRKGGLARKKKRVMTQGDLKDSIAAQIGQIPATQVADAGSDR